jgi:hypothetical protein
MPSLVLERALFSRERNDGLYRVATYLGGKMVDELALVGGGGWWPWVFGWSVGWLGGRSRFVAWLGGWALSG